MENFIGISFNAGEAGSGISMFLWSSLVVGDGSSEGDIRYLGKLYCSVFAMF